MKQTTKLFLLATMMLPNLVSAADGEFVQLTTESGTKYRAYVAGPENSSSSVLIIHDWFGVTEFTQSTVDRFSALGYRTLALDLYNGKSASTHDEATELMNTLIQENTMSRIQSALGFLRKSSDSVAVVGFSLGGGLSIDAALDNSNAVDATAIIYGGGFEQIEPAKLESLKSPVLSISGSADSWSLNSTLSFVPVMQQANKSYEVYIYPDADHAYAQPLYNEGKNLDIEATRMTWVVLDDFLARHL